MIRRLLNKVLGLFKVDNKDTVKEKEINEVVATELNCVNCGKDLRSGMKSACNKEDYTYYIWCKSCNKVNKIVDETVVNPPNSEVITAFKLFKETGNIAGSYRETEDGENIPFQFKGEMINE